MFETKLFNQQMLNALSQAELLAFRAYLKVGIARYMDQIRWQSAEEFIPDKTNERTLWRKHKAQPPVAGRLTTRSRASVAGLLETKNMKTVVDWGRFNITRTATDPSYSKSLHGTIQGDLLKTGLTGKWSAYLRDGSVALNILRKFRPKLTDEAAKKVQVFKYMWEMRGRPFMHYAAMKNPRLLNSCIEEEIRAWMFALKMAGLR